ncbi:hypothetical protein DD238_004504 [Peronospora effusa]|uniref:Uncharacterized protein n=1 Tax=Peronospora effusa TaxID=542832 RepID=A0A3M6VQA4_9STRA|nr:hypothetical protein DD238_004504 [Peronospora effusa]RQM15771.1 hypothetical protein DD237_002427 [Peronospora effusa]
MGNTIDNLNSLSIDLNIWVYLDGMGYSKENSTGKIFFYITPMDATDLSVNSTASVAITMAQEGEVACKMDVAQVRIS